MFVPGLLVIIGFVLVHIFTRQLKFLNAHPRQVLMSLLSGGSIAYVFLHLVPELAHYEEVILRADLPGWLEQPGYIGYLVALLGIGVFYGIDKLNVNSQKKNEQEYNLTRPKKRVFTVHITAFALYNGLIGYLLPQLSGGNVAAYAVFFIVFSFHFIANNRVLHLTHEGLYTKAGRWILSVSVFIGWLLAQTTQSDELVIAFLFSFLTGGLILNIMNDELPEQKKSSFPAFITGLVLISVLLMVIL
ncbi:hypothetical protein [Planococcus lenghuensis]|uniref:Zinc permease n=1 Tax=Planococcus lenghuensis TaxID=2213202 RepID=A0A1Q2KW54_9BACL|nr:hypothetical protein [Planococcus lenghuensis]AQQ52373.1 hypothetical protein B0X71_04090 [Planococcus lenghuensis]